MTILILNNKIIYELFRCLKLFVGYYMAKKILKEIINELQFRIPFISPVYIIETALFTSIIPIKLNPILLKKKNIIGQSLKKSIIYAIIKIFQFTKKVRFQSFTSKLTFIFIKLYKKEHILYDQKISHLNKFLTI